MRGFRSSLWLILPGVAGVALGGCAQEAPAPVVSHPAPVVIQQPASPMAESDVRNSVTQFDPSAQIGRVEGVRPDDDTAAVQGIPLDQVNKFDTIVFTDASGHPVDAGRVLYKFPRNGQDITTDTLVVEYDKHPTVRAPMMGDLAVYTKGK